MTTRITGMVSGLDVDSLVKAGTSIYQSKLDKAKQSEQIAEWKQEQYQSIESDVTEFYNKYLDAASADSLVASSTWNTATYTSGDSSAVTAEAVNTNASIENFTVTVDQLASAATGVVTDYSNGLKITGGTSTSAIDISAADIAACQTATMTDAEKGTAVAALINKKISSYGMTASYSQLAGGMILKTTAMGSDSKIGVTDSTGTSVLKQTDGTLIASGQATGTNLKATITNSSGISYKIDDTTNKTTSNSVTLDGIKYTFTSKTAGTKLVGSNNVSDVQDKIESFVSDYNTLLQKINTKIYEEYDKDYQPLTDTQKESMSESEITKWEKKAQTGLLRNDEYLVGLATDMKNAMGTLVGKLDIEHTCGIKPIQNYTTKNGVYEVTSKTLKTALETNLEGVKSLFLTNTSQVTPYTTKVPKDSGILATLKVGLNVNVCKNDSAISKRAGNEEYATTLKTNELYLYLKDQTSLIAELEDKLKDKQDALYSKYSKLETSLSSLQSSSGIFSSSSSS